MRLARVLHRDEPAIHGVLGMISLITASFEIPSLSACAGICLSACGVRTYPEQRTFAGTPWSLRSFLTCFGCTSAPTSAIASFVTVLSKIEGEDVFEVSEKCQSETHAPQQKAAVIRSRRRQARAATVAR